MLGNTVVSFLLLVQMQQRQETRNICGVREIATD